jgi:large subunit ribosomal protein L17
VAAAPAPRKAARKATAQRDKVEALAREDEAPATPAAPAAAEDTEAGRTAAEDTEAGQTAPGAVVDVDDQDTEPPVSASGDKGAEGPGDQAEGDDEDEDTK